MVTLFALEPQSVDLRPYSLSPLTMISTGKTILPIILISALAWGLVDRISIPSSDINSAIAATVDDARLDRPVKIELGSKAIYHAENLEITIASIRDGRCPKNANCYWGGEAKVTLIVRKDRKNLGEIELTLGTGNPDYLYPNNIKKLAGYYIRAIEIEPYPTGERSSQDLTQSVTLQVQKSPFKLKNADLDPKLKPRPLDSVDLGKRFAILNNQSSYLAKRVNSSRSEATTQINFNATPIAGRPDTVEIFVSIQPVGSSTILSSIRQKVKLGTPLKIEHRAGGFKLRLFEVKSFTEDTRSGLNYPSRIGYRAMLKVESLNNASQRSHRPTNNDRTLTLVSCL